ncbi:hypothetical protein D9M68_637740 [compost metagenome]
MRRKYRASSCSMVPMVTPRARCERNFTHSKNSPGLRSSSPVCRCFSSSSQVVLYVSQTSVVRLPRTARAFSRAERMQEKMDEGFSGSRTMYSSTSCGEMDAYFCRYRPCSSEMRSTPSHEPSRVCASCGSSDICRFTSSMRAVFSARSV